MSLLEVFAAAADGHFPPQDGQVEVHPGWPGPAAAVVAFPAHFYVLAPVDPAWVRAQLPPADLTAPLGARFLVSLAERLGTHIGSQDAVLAARAGGHGAGPDLREISGLGHPRVLRAQRYRNGVRVWQTGDGQGCLVLGRGLAGRWEASFEVEARARGRGLGRALAAAALALLPAGTPVFAQVAPGNSFSLRAALAAGYRPIGGEVLLSPVERDGQAQKGGSSE
jgi:GNAT superfamily N-acetyltransferase